MAEITPEIEQRMRDMLEAASAVGAAFGEQSEQANRAWSSLVSVLVYAVGADRLWRDGTLGLGGVRDGITFGIVPFRRVVRIDETGENVATVSWSVHT